MSKGPSPVFKTTNQQIFQNWKTQGPTRNLRKNGENNVEIKQTDKTFLEENLLINLKCTDNQLDNLTGNNLPYGCTTKTLYVRENIVNKRTCYMTSCEYNWQNPDSEKLSRTIYVFKQIKRKEKKYRERQQRPNY